VPIIARQRSSSPALGIESESLTALTKWCIAVAALCGSLMASVAWRVYGPSVHPDEWGFLLNGQVLTGHHQVSVPTRSFYPAAYGLITGLGSLLTGSLAGSYRFALFSNLACAVALAWLTIVLASKILGVSRNASVIAACLVFVMPGTIVSAMFSWPETAARLVFMVFVVGLHKITATRRSWHIVVFGFLVGVMPALHGRFTLVLPVVCCLFLWWGVKRDVGRMVALAAVFATCIGYECARLLNKFVKIRLYPDSLSQDSRLLKRLIKPKVWPALIRTMVGQSWYLLASTAGLVLVGIVFAVWSGARAKTEGPRRLDPTIVTSIVTCVSALLVMFTGGLQLLYGTRADHHIYGRYVEILVPVLIVFAVAGLERMQVSAHRVWLLGALSIPLISVAYVVIDGGDVVRTGALHNTLVEPNVPAIDAVRYLVTPGLISLGLLLGGLAIILWGLGRWRWQLSLGVLVLLFAISSSISGERSILARDNDLQKTGSSIAIVNQPGTTQVGFDEGVDNDRSYYFLRYRLDPIQVVRFDVSGPDAIIPPEFNCVYGFADRPPTDGQWESVADEVPLLRVLWRRVGATHC